MKKRFYLKNKPILMGSIVFGATLSLTTYFLVEKSNKPNEKISVGFENNTVATTQNDYEEMKRLISANTFDVGNPLFELAVKLNANPNLSLSQLRTKVIADNTNTAQPKLMDDLIQYNLKNQSGWTLDLSGYKWDNISLSAFELFSKFQNITSLRIAVLNSQVDAPTPFNISTLKDVEWIQKLMQLTDIEVSIEAKVTTNEKINISDIRTFDKMSSLRKLNLNKFVNSLNESIIVGDILNSSIFSERNVGFVLWMPTTFQFDATNQELLKNASVKINNFQVEFEKLISASLPDPTDDKHDPITIDGQKYEAFIFEGKWYWMLDDINLIKRVSYRKNDDENEYSTTQKSDFSEVTKRTQTYDSTYTANFFKSNSPEIPKIFQLTPSNISDASDKFEVDGNSFGYVIVDSQAVPDFDVNKIKFAYLDDSHIKHYYTDFSLIPSFEKLGNLSSVYSQPIVLPKTKTSKLLDPADLNDVFTFDGLTVKSFLSDGVFHWELSPISTLSEPLYYSPSLKAIFTSIEKISKLTVLPTDINKVDLVDWNERKKFAKTEVIKNAYQITSSNINDLKKTINIGGHSIGFVLRDGKIYYDNMNEFQIKLNDIKFVHKNTTDDSKNEYFLSFAEMQAKYPTLAGCFDLVHGATPFIPSPYVFREPTFEQYKSPTGSISVMPYGEIRAILREGKLFWDSSNLVNNNQQLSIMDIKYYDSLTGNFFIDVPSNVPKQLTEVSIMGGALQTIPAKTEASIFSDLFRITDDTYLPFSRWGDRIVVDGIERKFLYHDSQIVWLEDFTVPAYIYKFADQTSDETSFITSRSKVTIEMLADISEIEQPTLKNILGKNVNISDLTSVYNPTSISQTIKVRNYSYVNGHATTEDNVIKAIEHDGKLFWDNFKFVNSLKYRLELDNGEFVYSNSLNSDTLKGVKNVESVYENKVSDYLVKNDVVYEYKSQENVSFVTVIAIVGSLAFISIPVMYLVIKFKKKR